jgi:hypothetical protein
MIGSVRRRHEQGDILTYHLTFRVFKHLDYRRIHIFNNPELIDDDNAVYRILNDGL